MNDGVWKGTTEGGCWAAGVWAALVWREGEYDSTTVEFGTPVIGPIMADASSEFGVIQGPLR